MKEYQPGEIRNFAIVGHASSGKTMLSEAMLACAGVINRMGSIAGGSTVSDYHENEQHRQISVSATLMHLEWLGKKFNILDCPGYADFISEGLGALRVGDFALVVVHANHGVGVGIDDVWKYATEDGIPKMIVVNAFDKEETDFDKILAQVRQHFGDRVFPLTIPINPGPGFNQLLDVPRNEIITYATDKSGKFTEAPTTGEWAERANELHKQLIEYVAESDDTLMEKFFDKGGLSEEEWRAGIHLAVQKQVIIPLFITSAENNIGVARMMDIIAKYGSSPVDRAKMEAADEDGKKLEVSLTDADPVCYVFKTMSEAQFGELSFFRIYSGSVKFGSELYNTARRSTEKIGQIYLLNGKTRTSVPALHAGDIGAVVKLKDTHTGNTLCSTKKHVALPKVDYPKPNIHAALKSNAKGEEDKIASGLAALHHEDPTFLYMVDAELHQTILSAQGELHLEVIADRLRRRYNVHVELMEPRVRYRETIKAKGDSKYRHKKQTGGAGQFGEVFLRVEPLPRGKGYEFVDKVKGGVIPNVFIPAVEKGVRMALDSGVIAGYPVHDIRVTVYDGKHHAVDSKEVAFVSAGRKAIIDAFSKAGAIVLEPVVNIEIAAPDKFMGDLASDLSGKRGQVTGTDNAGGELTTIKGMAPLSELSDYQTRLKSVTGGQGSYSIDFSHYAPVPPHTQAQLVSKHKQPVEEEQ